MSTYIVPYVLVLIVFGILDAIWLSTMGARLYKPVLGELLADKVRIAPAIIFYLMYPLGLVIFALVPALRTGSLQYAVVYAALFGLFAYATYDLTNFATMKIWTTQITVIDLAWGTFASGLSAAVAYVASRAVMNHFGWTA